MRRVERVGRIFSTEMLVGTAFAVLALVLFAAAMTANLNYDEEQYVAGAYFARSLSLYRDFISFQPPTYTWITAAVFQVIDGWYLLTARVLTWVLACASCVLLYSLLRSIGTGRFAAFVLLLAFIASPFMRGPLTESRNDMMPLFFVLVGLRTFFGRDGRITAGRNGMLWSGFFLSLAAATKYSYLFAAPIAAAVILYDEYVGRNGRRVFASPRLGFFVLGASLGLFPLLYALAVHQDRFVFMTLHFHTDASFDWYRANGYGEMLTIGHKLRTLPAKLVQRGNATVSIIVASCVIILLLRAFSDPSRIRVVKAQDVGLVGLFLAALVIAIIVGPHAMYYAPVAAFGVLLAGRLCVASLAAVPRPWIAVLLLVSLIPAVPEFGRFGRHVKLAIDPEHWTGVQSHRSAMRIAQNLAARGVSGHVATLFPIAALDTNPILPEFATGPFFFRSAYLYSPERIAQLHGAGAATLDQLFANSPPAAVVAGFGKFRYFNNMDAALIEYARRSGYIRVADEWQVGRYKHGQVWVRP